MRNLYRITKEDFINLVTNPMWVMYALIFPLLLAMVLSYLTKGSYGSMITSYDYYGITIMIYFVINSGMTSANAFMEERIKKPNMRIIYAPGSVSSIYLSKIISSFLFNTLFHVLDLVILHLVFHVKVGNFGLLILLFIGAELVFNTLGVMLCCIFKSEEGTNQIQSIIVNLLAIFGGVLFSMDSYGTFARTLSMCSPVKWFVKASFELIYDHNLTLYLPVLLGCVACVIVMMFVCKFTFNKEDCIC